MSTKVEKLEYTADRMEQYSGHNLISLYGLPEEKRGGADFLLIQTVKEKMSLDISSADIDRIHRIGAPPYSALLKQSRKVRPVIVKFVRYKDRIKVHVNKKLIKGTKLSITESLAVHSVAKLPKSKEKFGFKNVRSNNDRIIYKYNGDYKIKIYFD